MTTTKVSTKPASAIEFLETHRAQLETALPKHITVDKMLRLVMTQCRANPDLLQCDQASLIGAVMQCCFLGLQPGDGRNHISLIPFKGVVKPIIEYQGMIELLDRSGSVQQVFAEVVYHHDYFSYEMNFDGKNPQKPVHKPSLEGIRTGAAVDIKLAYAVAIINGTFKFEYLSTKEISAKHQKKTDPWRDHWSEMAKKTAIRRLYKTLPKSDELSAALAREDQDDFNYGRLVQELLPKLQLPVAQGVSLKQQMIEEGMYAEA